MQVLLLRITNGCFQHCKDLEHHCKTLGCNHDEVFTYLQVDYEYFYSEFSFKQHSTECISVIYAYHNCGLVFHLNCIVLFRMPKSKEVLSSSSDSDSDSEVDTKVWKRITLHYTFSQLKEMLITSISICIRTFVYFLRISTSFILPEHQKHVRVLEIQRSIN